MILFSDVVTWRGQEEGDELRRSLRGISENLDAMEAGGLMWHEVRQTAYVTCRPCPFVPFIKF